MAARSTPAARLPGLLLPPPLASSRPAAAAAARVPVALPRLGACRLYAAAAAGKKEKVLLLGSGWAGIKIAKTLNLSKYELSVVSPVNHFVFTPLLASSAVGTLEFRNVTEAVKRQAKEANYYEGTADSIDLAKQQVHCISTAFGETKKFTLGYDKLVVACGGIINTFGTPGVEEYGTFLKTVSDARRIRARLIECFDAASAPGVTTEEKRRLLHFAIVGGGPTGVEFSAELKDFVEKDAMRVYPDLAPMVKVSIFDVAPKILAVFDEKLVDYVKDRCAKRGIQIRTSTIIKKVHKTHLELKDQPDEPYGLLVWSTGITMRPLVANFDVSKDRTRRIVTDAHLRVFGKDGNVIPNVYAVGDCATVKDNDLPPTAQVASQKGIYLAKELNKSNSGSNTSFTYNHLGTMAYVGARRAIWQNGNKKITGYFSYLMWRTAYFGMTMSIRNKIMLPVNWVLSAICGRDISRYM